MRHIVGYRGFNIVKDSDDGGWRIERANGERAVPGDFGYFGDARERVDEMKRQRL